MLWNEYDITKEKQMNKGRAKRDEIQKVHFFLHETEGPRRLSITK